MVRRRPVPARRAARAGAAASALVCFAASLAGCDRRDDLDGARPPAPAARARPEVRPAFSLADNRAAAVVVQAGRLTVHGDGARIVPYIDGGVRGEWTLHRAIEGQRAALIHGRVANLFVPLDGDPGGVLATERDSVAVAMRLRPAAANQVVSVFANETRVGELRFPETEWAVQSIDVPRNLLHPGENRLRLFFRHLGELEGRDQTPGALDWLSVGGSSAAETASAARGDLRTPQDSRTSFFVRVPKRPSHLRGRVESAAAGRITLTTAGHPPRQLHSGVGVIDVDLSSLAGEVVRLDLHAAKPATWRDLGIVVEGEAAMQEGAEKPPAPPRHIIVWSVSSLRADGIGDATGHFAGARRRGQWWKRAYSPAPSPPLAHAAVMTGRPAPPGDRVRTLAARLGARGYSTALISGNGFINDSQGFARGFDHYQNPMRLRRPHSSRVLWQLARRFLNGHQRGRTFLYIATSEPHLPYTPSQESLAAEWGARPQPLSPAQTTALSLALAEGKGTLTSEQKAFVEALYAAEVRDADRGFGAMLADLEEMGLREDTAIILFGDHGEELFERGRFGHGLGLGDEELEVPLILLLPKTSPGPRGGTALLTDLHPTILELAGLDAGASGGRSLFGKQPDIARPAVFRTGRGDWAIRDGDAVLETGRGGELQLRGEGRDDDPLAIRYLRAALSFAVAFDGVWTESRWGRYTDHHPAFPADQGL